MRKQVSTKKEEPTQGNEGLGEFSAPESKCGRNWCRQRGTPRSGADGTRCRAHPKVRQLHGGFASHGPVVEGLRRRHRGDAAVALAAGADSDVGTAATHGYTYT